MPDWDWQQLIVVAAMLWAAVVILRRAIGLLTTKSGGCTSGTCGGCSSGDPPRVRQLITLEGLPGKVRED